MTLTLGERIADLGLFTLQALVFLLVGGAMMTLIDWAARRHGGDKVSRAQYLTALALSFFLGLFLQWEESYRNSQPLKTQNESLSREIASLRKELEAKNKNVDTLERRFDKFTAQLTAYGRIPGVAAGVTEKGKSQRSQNSPLSRIIRMITRLGTNVVNSPGTSKQR